MASPPDILRAIYERISRNVKVSLVANSDIAARIEDVARNVVNRACVRVLLACSLAKIHNPSLDIRKPYTEIGTPDAYAGRTYDERYIGAFIEAYQRLLLEEPDSAVRQSLKESFLALRLAAETAYSDEKKGE